ncbi:MAG: hypothetical protein ACFFD2_06500 [Promethearchaeota archaeon]
MINKKELFEKIQNSIAAFIIDEDLAEDTYIRDKKPFSGNVGVAGIAIINKSSLFCWKKAANGQFNISEILKFEQTLYFHDILDYLVISTDDLF